MCSALCLRQSSTRRLCIARGIVKQYIIHNNNPRSQDFHTECGLASAQHKLTNQTLAANSICSAVSVLPYTARSRERCLAPLKLSHALLRLLQSHNTPYNSTFGLKSLTTSCFRNDSSHGGGFLPGVTRTADSCLPLRSCSQLPRIHNPRSAS